VCAAWSRNSRVIYWRSQWNAKQLVFQLSHIVNFTILRWLWRCEKSRLAALNKKFILYIGPIRDVRADKIICPGVINEGLCAEKCKSGVWVTASKVVNSTRNIFGTPTCNFSPQQADITLFFGVIYFLCFTL